MPRLIWPQILLGAALLLGGAWAIDALRDRIRDRAQPPSVDYIVATHYSGDSWAPDFWGRLDLRRVPGDLREIRRLGFNTVILVVPWVGFQPAMEPLRYRESYFSALQRVLDEARKADLRVMLRIGYAHDLLAQRPNDYLQRPIRLLRKDPVARRAWFAFLDRLEVLSRAHPHVSQGFISWEDFFILDLMHHTPAQRLDAARRLRFHDYLAPMPLKELNALYGTEFSHHRDIPVPTYGSEASKLFLKFWDEALLELFVRSRSHYPKLSMEVRVDCEPVPEGHQCHESTFDLAGEEAITMLYYSVAWGAPNQGDLAGAKEAADRLAYMLDRVRQHTDNPLFIDQFNFIDNTPQFAHHTRIDPEQLPAFIERAGDIIAEKTIGYGLWTANDVMATQLANGSFERSAAGWKLHNAAVREDFEGNHRLFIAPGGRAEKEIEAGTDTESPWTLTFTAYSRADTAAPLWLTLHNDRGGTPLERHELEVATHPERFTLTIAERLGHGRLVVEAPSHPLAVDDWAYFNMHQENGILAADGSAKPFLDDIVRLNRRLIPRSEAWKRLTGRARPSPP